MYQILKKIAKTGIITEPPPEATRIPGYSAEAGGRRAALVRGRSRSAMQTPDRATAASSRFVPRTTVSTTSRGSASASWLSPRHADMLLVTGPVSRHGDRAAADSRRHTRSQTRSRWATAAPPAEYSASYASCGRVSNVLPVDVAVPGCPPAPVAIIKGILTAIELRAKA
jgi:hypothetical protein